jgi:hypothetical protein
MCLMLVHSAQNGCWACHCNQAPICQVDCFAKGFYQVEIQADFQAGSSATGHIEKKTLSWLDGG